MKRLILLTYTFALLIQMQFSFATPSSDTDKLLNWAEKNFPQFFPSHQVTQNIEPWLFRFYPETNVYAGINKNDQNVYVLGGPWGNNPTVIDTLANLINQVDNSGSNGGIAACDTTDVISGVFYSQSGNVVSVTSNGQCITAPDLSKTNLCQVPHQTTASGISLLGSNTVTSSNITGLEIPGFNLLDLVNTTANVKHCTRNAPAATANLVVNSDLCLDITAPITETLAGLPIPGIALNPPVNYFTKGTYTSTVVDDCFATDATTISDAFTGEVWVNQSGSFVKVK
ncbi:MAG: hypothetical protein HRU78_13425 [Gammaproteobacteria bacterium]|nr:MAG: hypothetical protein HRU78_13425 [Gammaproteobacteria bacterium]